MKDQMKKDSGSGVTPVEQTGDAKRESTLWDAKEERKVEKRSSPYVAFPSTQEAKGGGKGGAYTKRGEDGEGGGDEW